MSMSDWERKRTMEAMFAHVPRQQRESWLAQREAEQKKMDAEFEVKDDVKKEEPNQYLIQAPSFAPERKAEIIKDSTNEAGDDFADLINKLVDMYDARVQGSGSGAVILKLQSPDGADDMERELQKQGLKYTRNGIVIRVQEHIADLNSTDEVSEGKWLDRFGPHTEASSSFVSKVRELAKEFGGAVSASKEHSVIVQFSDSGNARDFHVFMDMEDGSEFCNGADVNGKIVTVYDYDASFGESVSEGRPVWLDNLAAKLGGDFKSVSGGTFIYKFSSADKAAKFAKSFAEYGSVKGNVAYIKTAVGESLDEDGASLPLVSPQATLVTTQPSSRPDVDADDLPGNCCITSGGTDNGHTHIAYYDDAGNGETSSDEGHKHTIRSFQVDDFQTPDGSVMHQHPGTLPRNAHTPGAQFLNFDGRLFAEPSSDSEG